MIDEMHCCWLAPASMSPSSKSTRTSAATATVELLDELGLGNRFAALPRSRVTEVLLPGRSGGFEHVGDFTTLAGSVSGTPP